MRASSIGKWSQRRLILVLFIGIVCAVARTQAAHHDRHDRGLRLLILDDGNETSAPTATNATNTTTFAPTIAPSNATTNVTTFAPTASNTSQPTKAPSPGTASPTLSPSGLPTKAPAKAPTSSPTMAPSGPPTPAGQHKGISFWRFVEKTIAYLILLVLALLGFGAFMANRYRIYFFLRGVWFTILRMECTLWLMRKLGIAAYFGYQPVDGTLNSSIFENELNEGLLMRETDT